MDFERRWPIARVALIEEDDDACDSSRLEFNVTISPRLRTIHHKALAACGPKQAS